MDNIYTRFKHMTGQARKDAMCRELAGTPHHIDFSRDVFTLSHSQRGALVDMAKAVGYRKPVTSYHSLSGAFFCYLQRNASAVDVQAKRGAGKRWDNEGIAK